MENCSDLTLLIVFLKKHMNYVNWYLFYLCHIYCLHHIFFSVGCGDCFYNPLGEWIIQLCSCCCFFVFKYGSNMWLSHPFSNFVIKFLLLKKNLKYHIFFRLFCWFLCLRDEQIFFTLLIVFFILLVFMLKRWTNVLIQFFHSLL